MSSPVPSSPPSARPAARPSALNVVVTSPPWAKDEPPSPKDLTASSLNDSHPDSRPSDVVSQSSSYAATSSHPASRWWAFTIPRPREPPLVGPFQQAPPKHERKGFNFKDRSMSWLPTSAMREATSFSRREKDISENGPSSSRQDWNLSITLPTPTAPPMTLSHNMTPGWETPWTARIPEEDTLSRNSYGLGDDHDDEHHKDASVWRRRKRRFRVFLLTNTYVPLIFRFTNITFTTAALGVAIRIRLDEIHNHVLGAVGSSPMLVIIFAPLTLVHVMVAIYLDYFGRPLGLWRTSAKLTHTLSEVLFICAWSAALSLCFDNFFTSLVPCASSSSTSWYSSLPRPPSPFSDLGRHEGGIGDRLCDDQLALICLVGVGLIMYCTNLVISLFRIFEKVKYHPAAVARLP